MDQRLWEWINFSDARPILIQQARIPDPVTPESLIQRTRIGDPIRPEYTIHKALRLMEIISFYPSWVGLNLGKVEQ